MSVYDILVKKIMEMQQDTFGESRLTMAVRLPLIRGGNHHHNHSYPKQTVKNRIMIQMFCSNAC